MIPTKTDVRRLVRKWQRRLRLMDWKIKISRNDDLPNENANVCACSEYRTATIQFVFDPEKREHMDMELLVIHELIHLVFWWSMPCSGLKCLVLETSVDSVAQALFDLERS